MNTQAQRFLSLSKLAVNCRASVMEVQDAIRHLRIEPTLYLDDAPMYASTDLRAIFDRVRFQIRDRQYADELHEQDLARRSGSASRWT